MPNYETSTTSSIPILLLSNNGLVKSEKFTNFKYVGDPLNTLRIFNEMLVDEIIVLDIDATSRGSIDYGLISLLASECRMPICYGGGISSSQQALDLIKLGVEKLLLAPQVL